VEEYQRCLEQYAPQLVAGIYLAGSIALGVYQAGQSDIDFITVLSREAQEQDIRALGRAHESVEKFYPRSALEGSYLQWRDLGRPKLSIAPDPCYFSRRTHPAARHDINPVTWWILRYHGIAVAGPQPSALGYEVPWESVHAYTLANLHTYWAAWTTSPVRLARLLTDDGIQWAVLGIARLLYALQERTMTGKLQAGEYALKWAPARWRKLVQEAVDLRSGRGTRYYRSRLIRAADAVAFLRYVIAFCTGGADGRSL